VTETKPTLSSSGAPAWQPVAWQPVAGNSWRLSPWLTNGFAAYDV